MSRVPYSKHQYTDLTVVPFDLNDSYGEIVSKSLEPIIEQFNVVNHITRLDKHLKSINKILEDNKCVMDEIEAENRKSIRKISWKFNCYTDMDHREWFRHILGVPTKEYKYYNMHSCPFPDHEDNHPSFMVHKTGYSCYGCNRKGNYWQFLKEYNNWDKNKVKRYLKSLNQKRR